MTTVTVTVTVTCIILLGKSSVFDSVIGLYGSTSSLDYFTSTVITLEVFFAQPINKNE